jgi:SagB-type dehydrogenase family enzyme
MKSQPPIDNGSPDWYVTEGKRGEALLHAGRTADAIAVFENILSRLGAQPTYGRAVILGRLGRCFHLAGRPDVAVQRLREAIDVGALLPSTNGVKGLHGALRSDLGEALRAAGDEVGAKRSYEAALKIAEDLGDLRGQGVELGRLAALAAAHDDPEEARTRYENARRLFQQARAPAMEAVASYHLARLCHAQQQWQDGERYYRDALDVCRRVGNAGLLVRCLNGLAGLLLQAAHTPGAGRRIAEARQCAEEALVISQALDPASGDTWICYGVLADVVETEARSLDGGERVALERQIRDYRELERRAPAIFTTLARIGDAPTLGRAVLLGQAGRCLYMARRPAAGIGAIRDAIHVAEALAPTANLKALAAALYLDLGDMLRGSAASLATTPSSGSDLDAGAADQRRASHQAYEASLKLAESCEDARGRRMAGERLGRIADQPSRPLDTSCALLVSDEVTTEYVFETDLLVDGPAQQRVARSVEQSAAVAEGARPMLVPLVRTWLDDEGVIRLGLPPGEPVVEPDAGCMVIRRVRREIQVCASPGVLWRLLGAMDGASTTAEILSGFSTEDRDVAARAIAALAAAGAIDVSGRPLGRFIHRVTKKGVLPGGGLESEQVLRLATDRNYRTYPAAERVPIDPSVPDRLGAFHALTRARRSIRDYGGQSVSRGDFDALLHTACSVTGVTRWGDREAPLRAYPSSGALYAVAIYPIVLRVDGLPPAVYHYHPVDNVLEVVKAHVDRARVIQAMLPVEREMVSGSAALICLTGCFPRHERKYGEGGYRMLVAEAGHVSQNLILAATALGLSARPFGGVFDDLLNQELGLTDTDEQFLLAVVVGYRRDTAGPPDPPKNGPALRT